MLVNAIREPLTTLATGSADAPRSTERGVLPPSAPRQRHRRLNDRQRTALAQAYREGANRKALAARYDINPTTVDAILDRAGVERRTGKISAESISLAAHLYEQQHLSCARIGERLGYDASTIRNALRRHGTRLRDTAGGKR